MLKLQRQQLRVAELVLQVQRAPDVICSTNPVGAPLSYVITGSPYWFEKERKMRNPRRQAIKRCLFFWGASGVVIRSSVYAAPVCFTCPWCITGRYKRPLLNGLISCSFSPRPAAFYCAAVR